MTQRYTYDQIFGIIPGVEGTLVLYEDYAKLESKFNDILDMLVKLGNDLGYGVIPDEYAYDRVGEILEKYRNVVSN